MPRPPKYKTGLIQRVAVLGSGSVKSSDSIYKQAVELGRAFAKAGFNICHGGYGGVMEAVARGCRDAQGYNTGIAIRRSLAKRNPWADAEVQAVSWKERLLKLVEMGDAYIFLDGATGTLNELFFVWEMTNKKLLHKPILILGKRLHALVRFLKKDVSLKIPENLCLVTSIPQALTVLKKTGLRSGKTER